MERTYTQVTGAAAIRTSDYANCFCTAAVTCLMNESTSDLVVVPDIDTLSTPCLITGGALMAYNTCDALASEVEHADPTDTITLFFARCFFNLPLQNCLLALAFLAKLNSSVLGIAAVEEAGPSNRNSFVVGGVLEK